jgi:hypothetical protein
MVAPRSTTIVSVRFTQVAIDVALLERGGEAAARVRRDRRVRAAGEHARHSLAGRDLVEHGRQEVLPELAADLAGDVLAEQARHQPGPARP